MLITSCATAPGYLESGRELEGRGQLYQAILEWQRTPADSPDYQLAQEYIEKAESRLREEVDSLLGEVDAAVSSGDLASADRSYRKAANLDPRRKDITRDHGKFNRAREMISGHEARAAKLSAAGMWLQALEEYRIILVILPGYGPAMAKVQEITEIIEREVEKHYQAGMEKMEAGDPTGARREFLAVLSLDPGHTGAREFFWSERKLLEEEPPPSAAETDYMVYTIKKGDSLSLLAEKFYGDKYKYPLIAEMNAIDDPTKVEVGQEIKLPRAGMIAAKPKKDTPSESGTDPETSPEEPPAPGPIEASTEPGEYTVALMEQAESFFESGAYIDSIEELKKVLIRDPDNEAAREILVESYYRQGLELFKNKVFEMALEFFEKVVEIIPDYKDIQKMLDRAREALTAFIDDLYKEGITYYRDQDLNKAMEKWSEVLRLDPDHEGAKKYSEKAQLLLDKLREIEAK
jgi:tetratricopeptide (TPR) repeat protein